MEQAFVSALLAPGPAGDIPAEHRIFGLLIGSWDLLVEWYDDNGGLTLRSGGEWHFGWVLEGRAVQDVWIVPARGQRGPDAPYSEYGTSLRFYDPLLGAWRSTWIGPRRNWIMKFIARRIDDEIVLQDEEAHAYRWIFSELSQDSFRWRNERQVAPDDWRLQQRFEARRMPAREEIAPGNDGREQR